VVLPTNISDFTASPFRYIWAAGNLTSKGGLQKPFREGVARLDLTNAVITVPASPEQASPQPETRPLQVLFDCSFAAGHAPCYLKCCTCLQHCPVLNNSFESAQFGPLLTHPLLKACLGPLVPLIRRSCGSLLPGVATRPQSPCTP
jgi:hypothetical protein